MKVEKSEVKIGQRRKGWNNYTGVRDESRHLREKKEKGKAGVNELKKKRAIMEEAGKEEKKGWLERVKRG